MKALSSRIQNNTNSSTNVVANNAPAAKTLPSPKSNLAPVISMVNSQLPLQKMSNIAGEMEGQSFSAPSGGMYAPIQRAEVELKGEKSLGARFNAFFFGQESTFTQLEKKYDQFKKEIKVAEKEKYRNESIALGNSWLGKHSNSKSENDLKKKQSIESMLASLSQAPAPQKAPEPGKVVIEPKVGPVLPILAPEPGKVVEDPKVDAALPVVQSNFSIVKSTHDAYKAAKKGSYSPGELFAIYHSLAGFLKQLNLWDLKFASPKNPAFDTENTAITEFRSVLNENFEYSSGMIAGTVKGINIENLAKGIFSASSLDAVLTLPNGNATGTLQNIQIKESGIEFSNASLAYSGNIVFGDIFTVGSPTVNISSNASGYDIRGAGDLQLNLDNIQASGHVEISYNTSTQTFETPTFSNAQLTAGLLNNTLHVTANNVNYAGVGALSADSASLQMDVMGKSFTGSGTNISYSKENGLDWGVATFSFPDEISVGGIVKVKGLEGIISGAADGYKKSGSGTLSLDLPDGSAATGTVAVSFEEGTGWKVDSITNGGITASILGNILTVNDIQIANGVISAQSGTMQLDIGGAKVAVSVNSISIGEDKKFDWGTATFSYPGELSIGGVVKVKGLEGTVSGAADGYKKSGTGTLSIDLPDATATGTLAVSYDEATGWKVDSITGGGITATVLGNIISVNDIQYANGVVSAQSGSLQLDMGGEKVDVSVTAISLGEDKKFNWGSAAFSYSGELSIGGVVKVKDLSGTVSGAADGYKKSGTGTLSLDLPDATASGTVAISHDAATGLKVDSITGGSITASVLGNSLTVNDIQYANGAITAQTGVMLLDIGGANAEVKVTAISLGEDKKFNWGTASFSYPGELSIGGVVKVKGLEGSVSGAADGYKKSGTGTLSVDLPGATASGTVAVSYEETTGWKVDSITGGNISAEVLGSVLTVNDIQYANGIITAQTGAMLLDIGGAKADVQVTAISIGEDKKLNWGSAAFTYPGELSIGGIVKVKGLAGTVSGAADGYKKSGTGTLSLELPNATVTGTVAVSHDEATGWKVDSITGGGITASVLGNMLTVNDIQIANGVITAQTGTMQLDIGGAKVDVNVTAISLGEDKKFDWGVATFKSPNELSVGGVVKVKGLEGTVSGSADGYKKSGSGNLSVDLPGATASGTVAVSNDDASGWKVDSITGGGISASVLGSMLSINEIQYVNGVITAQSGTMKLDIAGAIVDVTVSAISLGEDKKFNWGIAEFSSPNEINIGGILKAKGLAGTVSGEADGFKKTGVGTLSLDLPGASATGTVAVSYEEGTGWKVDSITNGEINATLLNGSLQINGNGISFENNVLGVAAASATVSTGGVIPGVDKVSGQAQNIQYKDGTFDWDSVTLDINAGLSFGDQLSFGLKTATLFGKSKGYQIDINDASGSISIGKWLTGEGTGSFSWDFINRKSPEITSANLTFLATSPELPKDVIPGLLPISFSVMIPFAAGPVPMEAGLSLNVDAGATVSIGGTMNYSGGEFAFGVQAAGNGHLTMGIRASLAVGSSALVSLGAFLEGSTKAVLEAGLDFNGKAAKQGDGYNFSDINANYKLGANVIAELSGGVEAKALLIFSKTLYKVKIKSWDMGRAEKTGSFNFLNGGFTSTGSAGVLEAGTPNLGKPVTEHQSLPFVKSMEAVAAAIDTAKKISANASSIAAGLDAGAIDKSNEELLKAKSEIVGLLRNSIDVTLKDPEFKKLSSKLVHYSDKLSKIIKENSIWEAELEKKKKNPPIWHITAIRGTPDEVYSRKIAEGKQKQAKFLSRNETKKVEIENQLSIYQKQIESSSNMIGNIDHLLDPLNEVDAVQEKVAHFNKFNTDIDKLKVEIDKHKATESVDKELDRIESDYISQDLNEKA